MHGRLVILALSVALALAAPAGAAAVTIGPASPLGPPTGAGASPQPCSAARCTIVGLGAAAPADGVVVRWRIRTAADATLRLRTIQKLGNGDYAPVASGPDVSVAAGAERTFEARVPIGQGGFLAVDGTQVPAARVTGTGSTATIAYSGAAFDDGVHHAATTTTERLLVNADVEPDTDGDGYGDDTQDACPGNAADHIAPCDTTLTFGSPLTLLPDPNGFSASGNPVDATQSTSPGSVLGAPAAGVLTRWRFRGNAAAGRYVLQLLRPGAGGGATVVAESPPTPPDGGEQVVQLPAQAPVRPGDVLGVRSLGPQGASSPADLGTLAMLPSDTIALRQPPLVLGDTGTFSTSAGGGPFHFRVLVQADVEPDVDGDGLGDVTQDPCPCANADLAVSAAAPESSVVAEPLVHTYTVRNLGPDRAPAATLAVSTGAAAVGGAACPAQRCALGELAPGASRTVTVALTPQEPGTVSTRATASSATPDAVAANDSASADTVVTPPSIAPPPVVLAQRACAHRITGTRDDDLLRGTQFGDRVVGLDGRDLEQGLGGDDCLEGGSGGDVLDGGPGNDRASGGLGDDRIAGGAGGDRLTGGRGNDRLSGGPGNDTLLPGAGKDIVNAGSGNDIINSVDGVRESIDCGPGRDTVRADRRDRLRGCERVTRR